MRLLAAIGLGGLLPSVNAMIADLVPARYVSAWATLMMSGVPLGGSTAAIIARCVVPFDPDWGWRCTFLIAIAVLPSDSEKSRETQREARFFDLLNPTYRAVTIWFLIATFGTLLAWYGLSTWLPRLMHTAGYDFGAALLITLALNLGAVLGSILTACAGVRYGPVKAGSFAALLAGASLLMLLTSPSISAVYVILVLAGIGTHGTQILVIAAVADFYPSALRGTALGWALGFGRIGAVVAPTLAGVLLDLNLGVRSNYLLFGVPALLSSLSLTVLARKQQDLRVTIVHDVAP